MQRPLCPAGAAVSEWLKANGKSQTWLAEQLGLARSLLWRWFVGETTPHIDSAAAIERLTGVPASMWATQKSLRPTGTEDR